MIAKVQLWGRTIGAVSLDEGCDKIEKTHRLTFPEK